MGPWKAVLVTYGPAFALFAFVDQRFSVGDRLPNVTERDVRIGHVGSLCGVKNDKCFVELFIVAVRRKSRIHGS